MLRWLRSGWVALVARPTTRPSSSDERGSTVLESALAIPSLIAVAFVLLWGLVIGMSNVRLAAAAHDMARGLARGEAAEQLVARAAAQLPGSQVTIDANGDLVAVTIRQDVMAPGGLLAGRGLTLEQGAVAPRELGQ